LAFAAQWLAYALPYRRFVAVLTDANARLGADVDRYSFIVVDLHHLLLAGPPGALRVLHAQPGSAVSIGHLRFTELRATLQRIVPCDLISLSMNSGSNSRLYGGFTNPRPDQSCARPSSSGPALVGIAQKWRSS
jgi:hypothetical protein